MSSKPPSVRTLARLSGFSKATVANALRGDPTVAPATAERIRVLATRAGYRRNPIVGAMMSALRRAQTTGFHGTIACVDLAEPERPEHGPFHRELVRGARARAEDLGFRLEEHVVGPGRLPLRRLETMLRARGIEAVLLLPSWKPFDLGAFDWSNFAVVSADRAEAPQQFHAVCCDHYRSLLALLEELHRRGFRRPGLLLEPERDERIQRLTSAAFHTFRSVHPAPRPAPILPWPAPDGSTLVPWFRRHRPDVILGHHTEALDTLVAGGHGCPEQYGFACLNLAKATRPCAGLDLQPRLIGARSVELLAGLLQRNERGLPACPTTLSLPARFVAGPTLGAPGAARRPRAKQIVG